ncbi:uncharacterized protein N7483_009923 [Penicillium malachiteum]|uniref:uncharacterized protein n=1 Tax=Penicillium malachiteum TaxID=1324776 RepID=UPI00254836AB|nr:uncharacterized protein N7483_009923 [Penicillium malachiteum]KAJ5718841.1 hypothetical protein N7483_009923 [Penicillium malachiteum]
MSTSSSPARGQSQGENEPDVLFASEKRGGDLVPSSPQTNENQIPQRSEVMQKVVQEAIILAGGAVAILLQVAEPGVGKGVDNHSNFAYRPIDRLRTTMTYIYCMVYGTETEKELIINFVHKAHAAVQGQDYSADDPKLQLWVAATLYAVGTDIYQRIFGQMTEEESEIIYREYSILAVSLRVPPSLWPETRQSFWQYWDHKIETIQVTDHARRVAEDLLRNKKVPFALRAVLPLVRLTTTEMLPPRLRDAYGLKTSRLRTFTYRVLLGMTRVTYPALPRSVRTYPMRYYLKDMRKRLQDTPHKG